MTKLGVAGLRAMLLTIHQAPRALRAQLGPGPVIHRLSQRGVCCELGYRLMLDSIQDRCVECRVLM